MLPHALTVMAAWGFDYVSHYAWGKDKIGTGYWSREKHELLLIGTRGKVPCPAQGEQSDFADHGTARRAFGKTGMLSRNDRAVFSQRAEDRIKPPWTAATGMACMG